MSEKIKSGFVIVHFESGKNAVLEKRGEEYYSANVDCIDDEASSYRAHIELEKVVLIEEISQRRVNHIKLVTSQQIQAQELETTLRLQSLIEHAKKAGLIRGNEENQEEPIQPIPPKTVVSSSEKPNIVSVSPPKR